MRKNNNNNNNEATNARYYMDTKFNSYEKETATQRKQKFSQKGQVNVLHYNINNSKGIQTEWKKIPKSSRYT